MMNNIRPGVILNEDEVVRSLKRTGRFTSGVPRAGGSPPDSRRLSPGELFARYAEAVCAGRRDQFLKNLSHDQFLTLCASLERSKP